MSYKIGGRNINNLRYVDDTTLMAESKEELKSLLINVKEDSEKAGLKLNIQKNEYHLKKKNPEDHGIFSITSWQIEREKVGFLGGTSDKESTCQCRKLKRCWFNPWVGKISWRRKWQSTSVLLPGKSHGQRILVGYSPRSCKESETTEGLTHNTQHTHTHTHTLYTLKIQAPTKNPPK